MGMHLEVVLKMAVRSDIFWSQIWSGFWRTRWYTVTKNSNETPPPTPNCTALRSYRQIHMKDLHILSLPLKTFMPSSANFNS